MIWQTFFHWVLAGWLGVTALNLSAPSTQAGVPQENLSLQENFQVEPVQSKQSLSRSTPLSKANREDRPQEDLKPEAAGTVSEVGEYQVQPEDVLQVTVYEEPDLTTKVRVSGNGEINFPLLGRIKVAGLSVSQTQEKITRLLEADYLVNPQVQVFINSYHARNVFVTGAVDNPGSYALPLGRPTTLLEAVAMAGGFTDQAAPNSTRIIRIEDGKETTVRVKANDIVKKGDKSKDVEVRPGDVVFVPESFF